MTVSVCGLIQERIYVLEAIVAGKVGGWVGVCVCLVCVYVGVCLWFD